MTDDLMSKLSSFTGDIENLAKELELTPSDIGKLWYQFLKELNEKNISEMEVAEGSILEWVKDTSNFPTVGETSDLGTPSTIYDDVSTNKNFWNPSLVAAIEYFSDQIESVDSWIDPVSLGIIENANAGRSFQTSDLINMHSWVTPDTDQFTPFWTYNIARRHGEESEDDDKTADALKKYINMQYTHTQPETLPPADNLGAGKLLRLLMPMNSHHVEVEDLDRNFWVISMVIQELQHALWDDDKIPKMFEKLFDETTQLWENIAYLWMTLAAITRPKTTDIHIEVFYLPNSEYQGYRKFDNFDTGEIPHIPTIEDALQKIDFLRYKYSQQNLVIIPVIRVNNYQRNWYSKEYYPYLFYLNRADNQWKSCELKTRNGYVCIDLEEDQFSLSNKIGAAREDKKEYKYCAPFSSVPDYEGGGARYYGLLRVVPEIKVKVKGNDFFFEKISFNVYDAATGILGEERRVLNITALNINAKNNSTINFSINRDASGIDTIPIISVKNTNQKYYMGELISNYKKTAKPTFTNAEFKIIKIGDFLPKTITTNGHEENFAPNPNNFEEITVEQGGATNRYDTATYGIGAMKNIKAASQATAEYHLVFANYCWYDSIYHPGMSNDSRVTYIEGYDVTPELLSTLSIERTEHMAELGRIPSDQDGLYATKIGISYWTGNDGIQWSSGLVCNLIYYCAAEQKAYDMGFVGMLDGYWTRSSNVFTYYEGNRWRRLSLKADSVTIKALGNEKDYIMTGGRLIWYDHNKEIQGIYEDESVRPRASMDLINQGNNLVLSFSNPNNPLDTNEKMYPYIIKPDGHIFKSSVDKLLVYSSTGVQDWVSSSYDSADINLETAANTSSYIITLKS